MKREQERTGERLQKFLAGLGIGSRRKIETWILEGKIRVNGKVAKLGDRVNEHSQISIDGRPVKTRVVDVSQKVILYNKPEGEISTRDDPMKRPTVFRKLPGLKGQRWIAVGRLDLNTRGLILFTTDGKLANRLMHPSHELEREYLCRVFGQVSDDAIEQLQAGIELNGTTVKFHSVRRQRGEYSNTWYSVVVKEGKYREVRRMWEAVGCQVSRLIRTRYGVVGLPKGLRQGQWLELSPDVVSRLVENNDDQETIFPKVPGKHRLSRRR
ncbi:MAG: pseudouridine synthase [Gammaproteobacteria bacterium]|nr:pseudouridine synthase [Gammaproteobacteria bacterium]NKB65412.1 pseudouridine synthase [Gammaproteobacteria bacterium]